MIAQLLEQYRDELTELHKTREAVEDWISKRYESHEKILGNIRLIKVEILIDNLKKHINLIEVLKEMNTSIDIIEMRGNAI